MERILYRSRKDRVILGVCGGLARYFKADPTIVRLIFVIAILFAGLGIFAYIILAIGSPLEDSQATEPRETIRENVKEIKNTAVVIVKNLQLTFSNKEKTGETKEPKEHAHPHRGGFIIGLIILVIGIIALLSTTGLMYWPWWFSWTYLWPVILIAIGLLFMFARRK
jgi:phage shock protein PspC (stress-responsive transcriptional regulator)